MLVLGYGDGLLAGTLTAINTTTSKPSPPIALARPGRPSRSPTSGVAYVASYLGASITVVDVAGWRLETTLAMPCGPTDLAITQDGTQLFAAAPTLRQSSRSPFPATGSRR